MGESQGPLKAVVPQGPLFLLKDTETDDNKVPFKTSKPS